MNRKTEKRPGIVCRLVRIVASDASDVPSKRDWRSHHVEGCPDCQSYFASAEDLESMLREEARSTVADAASLNAQIMRAVQSSTRINQAESRRSRRSGWSGFALTAGAAGAALVASFYLQQPKGTSEENLAQEVNAVVAVARDLSDKFSTTVPQTALALGADNPLQNELRSVYSDAENALNFLAANFLPTAPLGEGGAEGSEAQSG